MQNQIMQWRNPETDILLAVQEWIYKEPIKDQFIEHPRSIWLLWNYFRKVGLSAVANKLRSRFSEQNRNQKIVGLGVGKVLETPESALKLLGQFVIFLAPNHSSTSRTIVVNHHFIEPLSLSCPTENKTIPSINELPVALQAYRGWSPYSGKPIDSSDLKQELLEVARYVQVNPILGPNVNENIFDHRYLPETNQSKPSAVLFGLGNYAKTAILPNIKKNISLQRVHEIDPDQLAFFGSNPKISVDTSPIPRDDRQFDAWFIAGFHHTHTDLAIKAIERGAYAVIEKPLATTRGQYDSFIRALNRQPDHRFFLCFHKRYSKLHDYLINDIGCHLGEPIDMHCIVYEIPLPAHHWYNWPNSGSRLISNGCHWIDYFMYVNDYATVVDYRKWKPRGSDVVVQAQLENNAYLSMSLTDTGSQRLGVRDHIELRHGGVTVTMNDAMTYSAENRSRLFNKKKVNPLNAYARMYQEISRKITRSDKGDDLKTLRSSELTLLLEDLK